MIFARRVTSQDDRGDWSEDFEAVDVPRAAKVSLPIDDSTSVGRRRTIKIRATIELRRQGFTQAEIALAIGVSERNVRRWSSGCRALAESRGRV